MKNIGILGFAHGHVMSFGNVWKENPSLGIKIAYGWDHDESRAAGCCEKLGAVPAASVEELLSKDIDAVVISSETAYHAELVEAAANAGKAIICYKPLALTLNEADRIVEAVNKNHVSFTAGFQMRVDKQNLKIKELVDSGKLGKCFYFRRRHGLNTHEWGDLSQLWHFSKELNRDIFADDSSHPLDLVNFIFGAPESVYAELSSPLKGIENGNGAVIMRYPDGMLAEVSCCFSCCAAEITTEAYFEKGSIQQYFGDAPSCRAEHNTDRGLVIFNSQDKAWTPFDIKSPVSHGERIINQAYDFADFLYGRRGPICTAEEARVSLKMVLACYVSSREGRRVSLCDPALRNV